MNDKYHRHLGCTVHWVPACAGMTVARVEPLRDQQ